MRTEQFILRNTKAAICFTGLLITILIIYLLLWNESFQKDLEIFSYKQTIQVLVSSICFGLIILLGIIMSKKISVKLFPVISILVLIFFRPYEQIIIIYLIAWVVIFILMAPVSSAFGFSFLIIYIASSINTSTTPVISAILILAASVIIKDISKLVIKSQKLKLKENNEKIIKQLEINNIKLRLYYYLIIVIGYFTINVMSIIWNNYEKRILEYAKIVFGQTFDFVIKGFINLCILFIIFLVIFISKKWIYNKLDLISLKKGNTISTGIYSSIIEPKVIDKINIGEQGIKQMNPRVLITNENELPHNIEVFLESEGSNTNIRKLVIVYPSKKVYRYEFEVSKECIKQLKVEVE